MRAQARTLKIGDIELKLGTKVPCKLSEMQGILASPGEDAAAFVRGIRREDRDREDRRATPE